MESKKNIKISKKLILIPALIAIILLLTIIVTNIMFNINKDKYEFKSYECCDMGTYPQEIEINGQKVVITSPPIVEFPCGCSDEDLTIWQKTILVLRGI